MIPNLYIVYLIEKNEVRRFRYSPIIDYDYGYWRKRGYCLYTLTKPVPIGVAHALLQELERASQGVIARIGVKLGLMASRANFVQWCRSLCDKILVEIKYTNPITSSNNYQAISMAGELEEKNLQVVLQKVEGKVLLWGELARSLEGEEISRDNSLVMLTQRLYLEGRVRIIPGVGYKARGHLSCNRCGSDKKIVRVNCPRCGEICYYCEQCILMGTARFCEPLVIGCSPVRRECKASGEQHEQGEGQAQGEYRAAIEPELSFGSLTRAQLGAAEELRRFFRGADTDVALVWAVCGAGKTEVLFGGITEILAQGTKLLYAAPRRDVIAELYPRFKSAFPQISVSALYGGSPYRQENPVITMATTHQALRFCDAFDVVILDESDAFPYRGSDFLPAVLERTRRKGSKFVFLTATPDVETWKEVYRNGGRVITIPARHHGHKLPVPELIKSPIITTGTLDKALVEWLNRFGIESSSPVFIFVPSVSKGETVLRLLQRQFGREDQAYFVHSGSIDRDKLREEFASGKFPFLVTTTVMERGITVNAAQVLVLWADSETIFSKEALIQAAGRAGRSSSHPEGEVLLAGPTISLSMKEAVGEINALNAMAKEKGLIL